MGLSGFILELLVPGLILTLAGLVCAVEFEAAQTEGVSSFIATTIISAVLVVAYLSGVALTHSRLSLRPKNEVVYRDRLLQKWGAELPHLKRVWLQTTDEQCPETDYLSLEQAAELVRRLREYQMSTFAEAWAEQVLYQRNISRVAGNSLAPLLFVVASCVLGIGRRIAVADSQAAVLYSIATLWMCLLFVGLRHASKVRMNRTVDIFVRTDIVHRIASKVP